MTDAEYLLALLKGELSGESAAVSLDAESAERVLSLAERHSVAGMTVYALERLGIPLAERRRQGRDKALIKDITQQAELERIKEAFAENGIRHLPLKGSIIKQLYPQSDMRTMSDIDILIDPENAEKARRITEGLGYECKHFGYDIHDIYYKAPVMNVEIHRALFGEEGQEFLTVFSDPWRLCESEDGILFRFTPDAFFAYILAHAVKHLEEGGTGIRTIMDLWVCTHSEMGIDAERSLELLLPSGKEDKARGLLGLSRVWFGGEAHTDATRKLEQYILGSGTYGTMENSAVNGIERHGRAGYALRLIFPTYAHMRQHYPVLKKAPVLLPWCWLVRLVTKPFINRRQNADKLRVIMTSNSSKK